MRIQRNISLLLAGTCLVAAASSASAQDAAPQSAQANASQDIVVTAQKRPQLLIDVPQSITVVSGGTLETQHASTFQDYLKLVPGLQLDQDQPGESRLILRGLNTGGFASTVSVYLDETPFGSSSGLVNGAILAGDFDTFDLSRIEVLRGPQGTLYGASSLGGVLKFITNAPSMTALSVRGRAGVEAVKDGAMGYSGNLAVNIPIGPTLAFRASGSYRKDGGYIRSIGTGGSDIAKNINDSESINGRASLLFQPSEAVSLRLSGLMQDIDVGATSVIEADPVTLKPLYGQLTQSQFTPTFMKMRYRVVNGTANIGLGFADLVSSTSYSTQKQRIRMDFTNALSPVIEGVFGTPNEFIEPQQTNLTKFTQELRLSSQSDLLDWLVGGFYTNEKGLILQDFEALTPGTLTPIAGLPLLGHVSLASRYREIAGFANATLHLGEHFDIDFGGRYSRNRQRAQQISDGFLAGGPVTFPVARSRESVFTYSVAPKFKINKNTSLYARVAKGFRPGGPNPLPPGAPAGTPQTYESDSIISYEAGIKAQTADGRISVDAAVFHINWKNIQLPTTLNGFNFNANGGGARSNGAELTFTARPVTGLDLSVNGAYTDAKLTRDTPAIIGGRKGDQLPFTPKLSGSLNADYHWQVGTDTTARLGASVRHLSRQTANYDADFVATYDRQRRVRAYDVIDLNAGIDFNGISIDAYVKNLGNSHGVTSTSATGVFGGFPIYPGGAIGTGIIRPRTIGLTLGYTY